MMRYYYYLQVIDEGTEAQRISNLLQMTQLVCNRERIGGRRSNC